MAKTNRQNQASWRRRRDFKNALYDTLNAHRMLLLRAQASGLGKDPRPESQALLAFFLNYPRCRTLPTLEARDGQWLVRPDERMTEAERAAAALALKEITSMKVIIEPRPSNTALLFVQKEIDEMRRLGMWNAYVAAEWAGAAAHG